MKTLSKSEFNSLFKDALVEPFAIPDYTLINYDDDEFYFYYNAENRVLETKGDYKLTEDQFETIAKAIEKKYQEYLEEEREIENAPMIVDHYELYGVSPSMFI